MGLPKTSDSADPLAFILVPETGRFSLREILGRAYPQRLLNLPPTPTTDYGAELRALPREQRDAVACFAGSCSLTLSVAAGIGPPGQRLSRTAAPRRPGA